MRCGITTGRVILLEGDDYIGHSVDVVRLGLGVPSDGHVPDPVCGIPLVTELAVEIRTDGFGRPVLLCSESCLETWLGREGPDAALAR
ncbi:MAG: hypothetical protein ACLP6E_17855 [Acidimicrobiales bacterium]